MDLILLRHGETEHNTNRIISSDDVSLNDLGRLQIERVADKLHNMIIDRAIVSPLVRTYESFEIIRQYHDIPYNYDKDVAEIDAGNIKGMRYEEAMIKYEKEMKARMEDYIYNPYPGGESTYEAYERAGKVIRKLKEQTGNVLMITHGGFITMMLANILGDIKSSFRFTIDNGSLTLINFDKFATIKYINRI